ncbi:hypothetical protein N7450_011398 [Penicillium hetheringtonii]|uniref:Uncharacterized protein n=1 Tax=Penicillium hetheringtonii TaxID=911720 RepID=A0AAD6GMX5_9EURO|nr:hypothetical protein N7450_011398 [Penicillium hetheringtonii]
MQSRYNCSRLRSTSPATSRLSTVDTEICDGDLLSASCVRIYSTNISRVGVMPPARIIEICSRFCPCWKAARCSNGQGPEYTELHELSWTLMIDRGSVAEESFGRPEIETKAGE